MTNKSQYDPSRDTVGKIYRDAQMTNKHEDSIEIGDMAHELTRDLIQDINDAIEEFDKKEKPYYLMIHEKKDLQMKSAIARRMMYFGYRPWPEDDTVVFWKDPKSQKLKFCWALPHWSEMELILMNEKQFDEKFIYQIKAWKEVNLKPFGFQFHHELRWIPDPSWQDEVIEKHGK